MSEIGDRVSLWVTGPSLFASLISERSFLPMKIRTNWGQGCITKGRSKEEDGNVCGSHHIGTWLCLSPLDDLKLTAYLLVACLFPF